MHTQNVVSLAADNQIFCFLSPEQSEPDRLERAFFRFDHRSFGKNDLLIADKFDRLGKIPGFSHIGNDQFFDAGVDGILKTRCGIVFIIAPPGGICLCPCALFDFCDFGGIHLRRCQKSHKRQSGSQ